MNGNRMKRAKLRHGVLLAAALLMASTADRALASGGGGGGGGGGGTVSASACARITNFKVSGGYRPSSSASIGAIWTTYTVQNCGPFDAFTVRVDEYDALTGAPAWWFQTYAFTLGTNGTFGQTVDNDYVPLGTTYQVTLSVIESSTGTVLATQTGFASTPIRKGGVL